MGAPGESMLAGQFLALCTVCASYELRNSPLRADLSQLSIAQLDALAQQYLESPNAAHLPAAAPQKKARLPTSLAEADEELQEEEDAKEGKGTYSGPFARCVDQQSGMYASGGSCEAQAAFLGFDRDKSGLIDSREFRRVLEVVEEVTPSVAAQAMARRDLDSNGVIDLVEFKQWRFQEAPKAHSTCEDCCGAQPCTQASQGS